MDSQSSPEGISEVTTGSPPDLDAIERDLADVEQALTRLDNGTYWTDEITGQPIPAELLVERPTVRRAPQV